MRSAPDSASRALPADTEQTAQRADRQQQPRTMQPRRFQRGLFRIPVRIQRGSQQVEGETVDFTPGGLRLQCRNAPNLAPGVALNLTIQFGATCHLTAAAQVAYRLAPSADGAETLGIRFAGLRDWEQTIILSALKELAESDQSRQVSLITLHVGESALAREAAGLTAGTRFKVIERRQCPRVSVRIPIRLAVSGQVYEADSLNISAGGIQFLASTNLMVDTPLALRWNRNNTILHDIAGRIVACKPSNEHGDSAFTVSVAFSLLRDWEKHILPSFIQTLQSDLASPGQTVLEIWPFDNGLNVKTPEWYARTVRSYESCFPSVRRSCTHASVIGGWGAHLPSRVVTNTDINNILRVNGKPTRFGNVVGELSGIRSRHYAGSRCYPSDLAVEAARMALGRAGLEPKDVEVIIACGVSRDVEEPATACIIQEKLQAYNAYVFDLANACNGFISGIDVLDSFIASGRCETGLVVVGEVISQFVTWDPNSKQDLHMSAMSYTLGDGGGAVVMRKRKPGEPQGIRARWFLSDSSYWRVAVVPLMDAERRRFKSNAAEIEHAAMRHVPAGVRAVMEMLNWNYDDIALIVPHQVSLPIIENLFFKELRTPRDKVFWSFPRHGNVGAASMPVAFCQAQLEGRVKPGDKVLLVGGSGGFGAGVIGLVV